MARPLLPAAARQVGGWPRREVASGRGGRVSDSAGGLGGWALGASRSRSGGGGGGAAH
jgi:hypothetical protein